jgi:hypothetical protein
LATVSVNFCWHFFTKERTSDIHDKPTGTPNRPNFYFELSKDTTK